MENAQEASFLEGKFIRYLFTGRLHIKSRLWLSIMGLVGVALTMPLAVYAISFMEPAPAQKILMPANGGLSMSSVYFGPLPIETFIIVFLALIGVALLANVILSIARNRRRT